MAKRSELARRLGEGVLIVASILLAFGIEASWAARPTLDIFFGKGLPSS